MRDKYPFLDGNAVVGVIFFGSEGYMIIPDYSSYYIFLGPRHEPGPHATARNARPATSGCQRSIMDLPHFQNWIAACRSRKPRTSTPTWSRATSPRRCAIWRKSPTN